MLYNRDSSIESSNIASIASRALSYKLKAIRLQLERGQRLDRLLLAARQLSALVAGARALCRLRTLQPLPQVVVGLFERLSRGVAWQKQHVFSRFQPFSVFETSKVEVFERFRSRKCLPRRPAAATGTPRPPLTPCPESRSPPVAGPRSCIFEMMIVRASVRSRKETL